jgi:hypothetical protein
MNPTMSRRHPMAVLEHRDFPPADGDSGWHSLHLPWPHLIRKPDHAVPRVRWARHGAEALLWEIQAPPPLAERSAFRTADDGFTEGLWTQDVAECFIAEPGTGHYTEYNLSPAGAWWACHYTAPRQRSDPQPDWLRAGIVRETGWTETGWTGRMICPLSPPAAAQAATGRPVVNFTAVVAIPDARAYYSLAAIAGGERPDFHRLMGWRKLE